MRKEFESIEWDGKKNALVITTQKQMNIDGANDIKDVEKKLKGRLREIVGQVKILKTEAENIKSMLNKLKGKAGPIDPAS